MKVSKKYSFWIYVMGVLKEFDCKETKLLEIPCNELYTRISAKTESPNNTVDSVIDIEISEVERDLITVLIESDLEFFKEVKVCKYCNGIGKVRKHVDDLYHKEVPCLHCITIID